MIRFTCLCQNRIEAEDDLAGGLLQCPRCGRLNDVPTLSDLPHLADDGTYKVDVPRPKDDPIRLAELSIVYSKGTTDPEGDEIDLRIAAGELAVGADPSESDDVPLDDDGAIPLRDEPVRAGGRSTLRPPARPVERPAPRYDPETGELIVPVDLVPDAAAPADGRPIPLARTAIGYASGDTARRVTAGHAAVELLMPVNVTVMGFVFLAHVFLQFVGTITVSGMWFIIAFPLALAGVIISHYGNVIDEVGPQERDELPRPLRQCAIGDDLWHPFVNITCALAICYGVPVLVMMRAAAALPPAANLLLFAALMCVGALLLPGVMLTTNTSGTIVNLRPDRFIGMVRTCGASYALAILTGVLATVTYGFGFVAADLAFVRLLSGGRAGAPNWVLVAGYPMLAIGIYCAHLFCWHLGLIYRQYHAKFPWAFQRHVRDPMKGTAAGGTVAAASRGRKGVPRKDTKTKLRELRELERRRHAQLKSQI